MEKNMYSQFTNQYSLQKTLRFELIPQGKTLEYIEKNGLLDEDKARAEDYIAIKKLIDEYHKEFIEDALHNVELSGVDDYVAAYNNNNDGGETLEKAAAKLRKEVIGFFADSAVFIKLFKKELITELLPKYYENDEEKLEVISKFQKFTTYFTGFNENRKNMYSDEAKSTSIAFRIIDQNLPKYIDNLKELKKALKYDDVRIGIETVQSQFADMLEGKLIDDYFNIDNYSSFITQKGIDKYNEIIGGLATSDRVKIKGINEYINLHNQKSGKSDRVGTLKPLYKQILSDRSTASYLLEQFKEDSEVLVTIQFLHKELEEPISRLKELLSNIGEYNLDQVFIKNDTSLTGVSHGAYGSWSAIQEALNNAYDANMASKKIKDYDKYIEKRKKELSKNKSYSIGYLQEICGDAKIAEYYMGQSKTILDEGVGEALTILKPILEKPYSGNLLKDKDTVGKIKDYLDALKDAQRLIKPLLGSGKEPNKDAEFYGVLEECWISLDAVTPIYNKVRNYVTRKPYSTEKIKLNFGNSTLLAGWDINKEPDNTAIILRKKGLYYLGIMSKGNNRIFQDIIEEPTGDCFEKMEYKLLPGANKMLPKVFFSKSRMDEFKPSDELIDKYNKGTHKKGPDFDLRDCHKLIDFFKSSISIHEDWSKFDFSFSPTSEYKDMSDFYREVEDQGYKVSFKKISSETINSFVDQGKLYLFQIYNKDFSPYSKGTPNLHTLYWKELFSEENLKDVIYKLNGEAEVFYRKSSIDPEDTVVHEAKKAIDNKNALNNKKQSVFNYDIIKDRRYTVDKFQFHVPITLNFKAHGWDNINNEVGEAIKRNRNNYIIGIDRGERHLLYVSVIDSSGNIVEQRSLNQIIADNKGKAMPPMDYHALLDEREKKRDEERKNWQSIESIKELKEGYLSQVVHYITRLMVKYNAIVVMENLNSGFKRSRQKVEKQVYQKFEKMLIDKLNYLVDKQLQPEEIGGLRHAYQLTSKFDSFQKLGKQSGMLFYTEAWNTSKIDPTTGFVNQFSVPLHKSVEAVKGFWSKFEEIYYDQAKEMFAFKFKYSNFTPRNVGARDEWTVYTNGERISTFRNDAGSWDSEIVNLTDDMRETLDKAGIDYNSMALQKEICSIDDKTFHESMLRCFKLVLQMRNSKTGTDIDYIISPVLNERGEFFDSRSGDDEWPCDADANGAYNIARKGLMMIERLKMLPDDQLPKADLFISNVDWLRYAQGLNK